MNTDPRSDDTLAKALCAAAARQWRAWRNRHRHDYQRVGYGGAGWSLYRCECGGTEIDA